MRWDDRIFSGTHGKWWWLVVRDELPSLLEVVTENHIGQRLCVTAFDSGPITPSSEETALGWTLRDDVMISPPLTTGCTIPCGEFDEWYIFRDLPDSLFGAERFVNYSGFNLADPKLLAASQDPTWDRAAFDSLIPLQVRFWKELDRVMPSTYIGRGDYDVVVTSMPGFAKRMLELASNT